MKWLKKGPTLLTRSSLLITLIDRVRKGEKRDFYLWSYQPPCPLPTNYRLKPQDKNTCNTSRRFVRVGIALSVPRCDVLGGIRQRACRFISRISWKGGSFIFLFFLFRSRVVGNWQLSYRRLSEKLVRRELTVRRRKVIIQITNNVGSVPHPDD